MYPEALTAIRSLLSKIADLNKRTLDPLNAYLYFYYARIYERQGKFVDIREQLLDAYNKSCLKNDEIGQATLINLVLRNYMAYQNFEAAHNFIEKAHFPEQKSTNEYCKYLYYTAKVKAIRRDYQEALWRLNQAIRKAPDKAHGFKITCQRLAIIVELLLGEIPNREIFSEEIIFKHTYGYYKVIQAVLNGNLDNFKEVVEKYRERFNQDRLYTLIMRLNQIVIRVGLRKINNAYSRISLSDIAQKLKIDPQDVEFIVAKAIRDGVIFGEINHE
jgi:26S proteasome regulatory subunit N3